MRFTTAIAITFCLSLTLACGGGRVRQAASTPTLLPATPTAAPTAAPSATPDPAAALLAVVEGAAAPILAEGPITAERVDFGGGPRVNVTLPLNDLGSNEQIVRLNQTRMAGVARALFEQYAELAEVNVIGTLGETPAISLLVTRAEYTAWDGNPGNLPGWQVSERLR